MKSNQNESLLSSPDYGLTIGRLVSYQKVKVVHLRSVLLVE